MTKYFLKKNYNTLFISTNLLTPITCYKLSMSIPQPTFTTFLPSSDILRTFPSFSPKDLSVPLLIRGHDIEAT